jgi:hypothetical protein
MTTYDMSIDTISELDTSFYVEVASYFFCSEIGHFEALFHDEELIKVLFDTSKGHTGSVMSDTLPDLKRLIIHLSR